ncbi:MAG: phosphotransferase [Coxiellaceae bacterium]|nr:phosphotransferase [Coxiellaceae bacterium]
MTDISSKQQVQHWLADHCALQLTELQDLPQVISRRHYYRAVTPAQTYIVTDAREIPDSILSFASLGELLKQVGWYTPEVFQVDTDNGYLLQEDLGGSHWYDRMQHQLVAKDYQLVLSDLLKLQSFHLDAALEIPSFDWAGYQTRAVDGVDCFLSQWRDSELNQHERQVVERSVINCIDILQRGPQVLCHRDFHSRNIMLKNDQQLAHIDFQMLCIGPLSYDLASILRDAYVRLSDDLVLQLLEQYYEQLQGCDSVVLTTSWEEFLLWFDAATLLRHLRCIGLFARMSDRSLYRQARDYALQYLQSAAARHARFADLAALLSEKETN